jgi:mannosyltransferase
MSERAPAADAAVARDVTSLARPEAVPRAAVAALVVVIAVGAAVRAHRLGEPALWHDELASWVAATRPPTVGGVLAVAGDEDMHPPGYYLLLRLDAAVFGESELALRAPSALAGTLAIAALFALGRALFGWREGLIAAALCAVLPFPVLYSQEARAYALLLLGSILTVWLLVRAHGRVLASGEPPWRELGSFAALATLVAYLHYFGMLLVGLETIAALLVVSLARRRRLAAALLVSVPVVLAALWLPFMSLAMTRRSYWPEPPSWRTPLRFLNAFLFSWDPATAAVLLLPAAAAVVYLVRARAARSVPPSSGRDAMVHAAPGPRAGPDLATILCVLWIVLPFLVLLGYSWVHLPITIDRAMIIVLPPLYLLLARAVTFLAPRPRAQLIAVALMVALAGVRWSTTHGYRDLDVTQDYRGAVAAWSAAAGSAADPLAVLLVTSMAGTPLPVYYLEREEPTPTVDLVVNDDASVRALAAALRERAPGEVVVFCQLPRLLGAVERVLSPSHAMVAREGFGGRLQVRRYAWRGSSTPR